MGGPRDPNRRSDLGDDRRGCISPRASARCERVRGEDLIAGAGFFANFYWAPCFDGRDGCGDPLLSSHFWSLASEMQFYALAPFIAALGAALGVAHSFGWP